MKKETDLDCIKSTARTFLYLDINESPYGAMLVQHPFTNSGLVCLQNDKGHEFVNLLEDDNALVRWRDLMKDRIQECENVYQLYLLVNKPYRIAFLKYTVDFMSRDDMSQILADIWIGTESPNLDPNMSKAKLVSLFKKANPNELMNEDELRIFNQLADTVTIYRGVTSYNADNIKALSWTLDYDKAEWFANRFGEEDGTVYEAEIEKAHILAYFNRRNESEVIVDPKHLIDIEETQSQSNGMTMI